MIRRRLFLCTVLLLSGAAFAQEAPDLQALLTELGKTHGIPGAAAALYYDGQVRQIAVYGVANADTEEPVTLDTLFQIGSVSKPITATLAYVLSEKGILPVESNVFDVFPELLPESRAEYAHVDIRMLLTHTSGMHYKPLTEPHDAFLDLVGQDMRKRRYEYTRAALQDKPTGWPGEIYTYGGGTIILAAMMEQVTGRLWENLVDEYIFRKLGLDSALPVSAWEGSPKRAWGHTAQGAVSYTHLRAHET